MKEGCLTRVVLLPLAVILLAAGAAVGIIKLKPQSKREAPARVVPAADILVVRAETVNAQLTANGTVSPARRVVLSPEVSGRVTYVADELVVGGRIKQGQTLLRVDASDYAIALETEKQRLLQAQIELTLEQGRGDVAKREYQLLGNKKGNPDLALRVPQLKKAESMVATAEQAVKRAELNLARTTLRAPFNALVVNENAERGAVVGQGSQVATLIGTDTFWVEASVPVKKLPLLEIPSGPGTKGSKVRVIQELGGSTVVREGTVVRLAGSLDTETRTATVIIEVPQPLEAEEGGVPLFPDAFVTVQLEGEEANNVVAVPEAAVESNRYVYVLDDDEQLQRREVDVGWRRQDRLYIRRGLGDGDRVVVSPLASPVEGMQFKVRNDTTAQFYNDKVVKAGDQG